MACIENENEEDFATKNNANLQNVFESSHKAALSSEKLPSKNIKFNSSF